ncbi:hypothetical protein OSH10_22670 [Kaistia defluvii]|uniref:hypothetical protein n=1 Tax=Kaistia defluvii TaxID=410841 RepID=UPI00225C386A|nr:hypothetical protein [Kaistia defluvii]MCX5521249.1 hypothetical protein [Kaistia defluvii]
MLWIALFIIGLLGLLAGMVPLLLNGLSRTNFAGIAVGTVLLVAGAAGVIMKPSLPVTMPHIAALEPAAPESAPETQIVPPSESPIAAVSEPATPPAAVRVVEPAEVPAPSSKDESQLAPSALPDPVPVTTTIIPGGEPDPITGQAPGAAAAPAASPAEEAAAVLGLLAPQQPKDQAAFTQAVGSAREAFDKADDAQRDSIQPQRAAAICKALPKPEVKRWVGKIQSMEADSGKRLTLTMALPDGTLVKTWNNAMSDMEDQTLVPAGSPVAQSLGKLKTGDTVRFSGTFFADEPDCYRSSRLSLTQSMMEPSFLFRFTAVEKL